MLAIAVSRDERFLLTASGLANTDIPGGDAARLWDLDGNLLLEMPAPSPVLGVDFSADGRYFVTVEGHAVRLWRTAQGLAEWLATARVDPLSPAERDALLLTGGLP